MSKLVLLLLCLVFLAQFPALAQDPTKAPPADAKTAVTTPSNEPAPLPDPFDGATVEKMAAQCVTLETEPGSITIQMLPQSAPEAVRNFLNLAVTGALDTTTFSRTVKNFVVQGGNLSTSEKWGVELSKKASRKLPDEPGELKHVRGIVSMARGDEPNSATTHFFILVGAGSHLDGKFAAFGKVTKGIEVADTINYAPVEGDKPVSPVRIKRAIVAPCQR